MRTLIKAVAVLCLVLFVSCGPAATVTRFDNTVYPPTGECKVYNDPASVPAAYFEIGFVHAKASEVTGGKQEDLLQAMIKKAKECGAQGLIKIEFSSAVSSPATGVSQPLTLHEFASQATMIRFK
jgi:hypothetical protein